MRVRRRLTTWYCRWPTRCPSRSRRRRPCSPGLWTRSQRWGWHSFLQVAPNILRKNIFHAGHTFLFSLNYFLDFYESCILIWHSWVMARWHINIVGHIFSKTHVFFESISGFQKYKVGILSILHDCTRHSTKRYLLLVCWSCIFKNLRVFVEVKLNFLWMQLNFKLKFFRKHTQYTFICFRMCAATGSASWPGATAGKTPWSSRTSWPRWRPATSASWPASSAPAHTAAPTLST